MSKNIPKRPKTTKKPFKISPKHPKNGPSGTNVVQCNKVDKLKNSKVQQLTSWKVEKKKRRKLNLLFNSYMGHSDGTF